MTKLSGVRTLCAGASDIVIALVFTAVMNQRNLSADYLEGSNAIAPLPSVSLQYSLTSVTLNVY